MMSTSLPQLLHFWIIYFLVFSVLPARCTGVQPHEHAGGSAANNDTQAFVSVSDSSKLRVTLLCDAQTMNVSLKLLNVSKFDDWIIVGENYNNTCKQRGNGQLEYEVRVPLQSCGTKMTNAITFENVISIRTTPNLILGSDHQVIIRCLYGPPLVGTARIPYLPPSDSLLPSTTSPVPLLPTTAEPTTNVAMSMSYVYLILFLVFFLVLICLLCGCMYYMRARRARVVQSSSATTKWSLGLTHPNAEMAAKGTGLWWVGNKAATSSTDDALLSHDYMISSNSTRDPLSVSTTDSPETRSSSSGSPPEGIVEHGIVGGGGATYQNQNFVGDHHHHHLPMVIEGPSPHLLLARSPQQQQLRAIPEEQQQGMMFEKSSLRNFDSDGIDHYQPRSIIDNNHDMLYASKHIVPSYAQINSNAKLTKIGQHPASANHHHHHLYDRSITEINALPTAVHHQQFDQTDSESIATLYGNTANKQVLLQQQTVLADIHPGGIDSATLMSPSGELSALARAKEKLKPISTHRISDLAFDYEPYARALEHHRGLGPHRLSDDDLLKWRQMINNDPGLRARIRRARNLEGFEQIANDPQYSGAFSAPKWALIVQSLAHVEFMHKLTEIIDNRSSSVTTAAVENSISSGDDDSSQLSHHAGGGQHAFGGGAKQSSRRYLKKYESEQINKAVLPSKTGAASISSPMDETAGDFRDDDDAVSSANSMRKETYESPEVVVRGQDHLATMKDRGTSEIVVDNTGTTRLLFHPTVAALRERFDSEQTIYQPHQQPPTLSIYLGNVPERPINIDKLAAKDPRESFYGPSSNQSMISNFEIGGIQEASSHH